jgi:hypothetical protein
MGGQVLETTEEKRHWCEYEMLSQIWLAVQEGGQEIQFNKSLSKGEVPRDWKKANVTPSYKKGPKGEPGNYRSVSLTSVLCKILES